jgi:protease-4
MAIKTKIQQANQDLVCDKKFNWKILVASIVGIAALFILFILLISILFSSLPQLGLKPNNIAVIPLYGEIFSGRDDYDGRLSAEEIGDLIDKANNDPSIGAILIDIDSPGGEVVATKQIVYKIRESKKPVYSYINSIGASGGYYVASATNHIMADEDSITGSIGVISIFPNFQKLLENIGVKFNVIKEGNYKDIMSPFKDPDDKEKAMIQKILSETYEKFKADVLSFRKGKMNEIDFDKVADGRILSGRQAFSAKLVDELVQKNHSIKRVGELAGLEDPNPVYYGEKKFSFADLLFSSGKAFGSGIISSIKSSHSIQFK